MNGLRWGWIAVMLLAPTAVSLLAAFLLAEGGMIFGNIAGTAIIFGTAFSLILRECVEIDRAIQACLDAGDICWPVPSAFSRFAVYAFIGLAEVFALFMLSLRVERKMRDRDYDPQWR